MADWRHYFAPLPSACLHQPPPRLWAHPAVHYLPWSSRRDQLVSDALRVLDDILATRPPGDVCVYMPSEHDVTSLLLALRTRSQLNAILLTSPPLFPSSFSAASSSCSTPSSSSLSGEPSRFRILLTFLDDLSNNDHVPLDFGFNYVLDSGWMQLPFSERHCDHVMRVVPTSRHRVLMRSWTARSIFRLYARSQHFAMPACTPSEAQRLNWVPLSIHLHALHLSDLAFLSLPLLPDADLRSGPCKLAQAETLLTRAAPVGGDGRFLAQLAELTPIPWTYAALLLSSWERGCAAEILSIASCVLMSRHNDESILVSHPASSPFSQRGGDPFTMIVVVDAFLRCTPSSLAAWCRQHHVNLGLMLKALDLRLKLQRALLSLNLPTPSRPAPFSMTKRIETCLTSVFGAQTAHRQVQGGYRLADPSNTNGTLYKLDPWSVLADTNPNHVMYLACNLEGHLSWIINLDDEKEM